MQHGAIWKVMCWQIFIVLCLLPAYSQVSDQGRSEQIIVTVAPSRGGKLYKIDGSTVSDPLRALARTLEKYGDERPVVILVDNRLPISSIGEAAALAGKAGFKHVRSFAWEAKENKGSEIKSGAWLSVPSLVK
jgi:hypothetical protein